MSAPHFQTTNNSRKKVAVVLFNLGGPTGPKTIRPFLFNFFMDKNIIPFPTPLRVVFSTMISLIRSNKKGPAGSAYGEMGGGSPLLENTLAQQNALQQELQQRFGEGVLLRTYTCMRYWHPMAESVVAQVQAFAPDELVLVSLYPQQSSTTFWSSLQVWQKTCDDYGYDKAPTVLCCYPTEPGFIAASVAKLRTAIDTCKNATGRLPRVLLSAHSIPTKLVQQGDPYDAQCGMTVKAILQGLNIPDLDVVKSYQSKVGPQSWLGPQTEDEIKRAGNDKVPLVVYPHAFVSEHVETIVELGVEYREVAEHAGVPYYDVVQTVGTDPVFIDGLANQIMKRVGTPGMFADSEDGSSICPPEFKWCCQRRAGNESLFGAKTMQHVAQKCCNKKKSCCGSSCQ